MNSTTNPKALLPHEMNEVDRIFNEILSEQGLLRGCEEAEAIAARILGHHQRGVRDVETIKFAIGLSLRSGAKEIAGAAREATISIMNVGGGPESQISPEVLEMLQRTFERVSIWCRIPRYGKRAAGSRNI
ncbi:hypothetical protein LAC81_35870 (plasmid) [Ensifer adhaerens]|uniref:hypothetical protein n=1 Tax=Ensifer adhaerens TaxID=106592 RepID=UPI001CBEF734|nr:hypothetical protein [Ensifer adhaerens]MBZ7927320.1 hypothetical protein [Ensifer adhaerens]UAX98332.1 hypothetical protein LAC78_37175 [Ensifer adhaerens]UAY05715.1 hypothetical protein LAC80_35880 [Ensifer adhaerens]UAY13092.1 hypothetical protein LAC81_35870 [Ensifer adhaerens]